MKTNQKSVRLSDQVVRYIDNYRGGNFSEKLENMVLDFEEKHDQMVLNWERLQAQINDKREEARRLQERVQQMHVVDARLKPFADAILALLQI